MKIIIEFLVVIFLIISGCYFIMITAFNVAWFSIRAWKRTDKISKTKVTLIISVRNEGKNIIHCLEKVSAQNYPSDLFEIIVVDDSSSDETVLLVKDFISVSPLKLISLIELSEKKVSFKKIAINEAIQVAKGDLIITTDADCDMQPGWITAIATFYETYKPSMIAGPVCFRKEKGLFNKMQGLEFLSLIASGAASVRIGIPIMCNGANLAYERASFLEVGGYESDKKYTSGDDVFLIHKMKAQHKKIAFIKCDEAMVETNAKVSFNSFMNQRKRWVSKSRGYSDTASIVVALIVFLFNFSLLVSLFFSFFDFVFLCVFLGMFLTKLIIDLPILTGISFFAKQQKLMLLYIPLQVIYPVYVVWSGIMGMFGTYEWKGRVYSANESKQ